MIASFAAISDSGYFGRIGGNPGAFPFLFCFGFRGFLVISFLSGGLGATEALILSLFVSLVLVSFVVFVSVSFVWPFHTALANARP